MRRYLTNLARNLRRIGVEAPLLVVASNGGILGASAAGERPVFVVGSGPAAGVAGAARLGARTGRPHLITFDMGGTTAKASLVEEGRVALTSEYEFREGISTTSRFVKAGGYMLKVPAIDVAEVGAGAGSIAWIDGGGLLRVGPESAGALPGPACYDLGGERPTVTDANVVLGFLNPAFLAGGELRLDAARAHTALRTHVAEPLGMSVVEAAHGVRQVANVNMARAIRSVTIERGRDPRDYTLVAFGGSGPVHAVDVAAALDVRRVLVPVSPGVFTALGMLASDLEHHFVRAHGGPLGDVSLDAVNAVVDEIAAEARATLSAEGYTGEAVAVAVQADLRYVGQGSELTIPVPAGRVDAAAVTALRDDFASAYAATYGYASDEELELVNLRVVAIGRRPTRLGFDGLRSATPPASQGARSRPVSFMRGAAPVPTPVVARETIGATPVAGPVLIESYDSTVVVSPGSTVRADVGGSLLIEIGG